MKLRAIRGATCLVQDDAQEMAEAVTELLSEILVRNEVSLEELVSIFFYRYS